jgi:hypothetical protein
MLSRRCMFLYHCTLRHAHEPQAPEIPSCNLSSCLYNIHRVLNILKYKFKPKILLHVVQRLRAGNNFLWARDSAYYQVMGNENGTCSVNFKDWT